MPHRARIQRNSTVVLTLLVLALAFVAFRQHTDLRSYKQYVYDRCQSRLAYDAAQNKARQSDVELYRRQIEIERTNQFVDALTRARRIAAYDAAVAAKVAANAATPVATCKKLAP
jgi:hypothetical protein